MAIYLSICCMVYMVTHSGCRGRRSSEDCLQWTSEVCSSGEDAGEEECCL